MSIDWKKRKPNPPAWRTPSITSEGVESILLTDPVIVDPILSHEEAVKRDLQQALASLDALYDTYLPAESEDIPSVVLTIHSYLRKMR